MSKRFTASPVETVGLRLLDIARMTGHKLGPLLYSGLTAVGRSTILRRRDAHPDGLQEIINMPRGM
jgi:hypothetical protein